MVKLLYSISAVLMIFAFCLFAVSGSMMSSHRFASQSKVRGTENNLNSGLSILDQYKMVGTAEHNNIDNVSPLVEKAMEFALFLNPPKPTEPVIAQQPRIDPQLTYRPSTTPRFRVLSISYYLSSPEKSWALVSEPGKGEHWVKKGERIENVVVDGIEKGAIVYKDGNQLQKMNVSIQEPAQLAQVISHDKISITDPQNETDNQLQETPNTPLPNQIIGPG